jgi:hypothetical protein
MAAVEGFLEAEGRGAIVESYQYLSDTDREFFDSAAGWEAAHADIFPPVAGFTIESSSTGDDGTAVSTLVEFEPGLDEVIGLTPMEAVVTWGLVKEGKAWRISLGDTAIEPRYPPDAGATEAVRRWVEARRASQPDGEYEGGLLGNPGLAESLCNVGGDVSLGSPGPLEDQVDAAQFIAAFGPEFDLWGRVVPVTSPAQLRVVVAPVGDQWVVIGVLPGDTPE